MFGQSAGWIGPVLAIAAPAVRAHSTALAAIGLVVCLAMLLAWLAGVWLTLWESREDLIEIGSGANLALLFPQLAQQFRHGFSFLHKAAEVALWLA